MHELQDCEISSRAQARGVERSIRPSPAIVVVDGDHDSAKNVMRVMRVITDDVRKVGSIEQAVGGAFDLLLVNHDALESRTREDFVDVFPDLVERGKVLLYTDALHSDRFGTLLQRIGLTNFIASNRLLDAGELLVTAHKLVGADPFSVEKYLSWGAKLQRMTVRTSTEIGEVVELAAAFARQADALSRIVMHFGNVTDELLSNALYNAPRDPQGQPLYQHFSRREAVTLPADHQVEVCLGTDGVHLAVSVRDPYGSLPPPRVVEYLAKCFRGGPGQVDDKDGGAGLGLYCAFCAVSRLIFNVAPGRSTEAIGLLDIRGSYRDFAARGKSFNIFVSPAGEAG